MRKRGMRKQHALCESSGLLAAVLTVALAAGLVTGCGQQKTASQGGAGGQVVSEKSANAVASGSMDGAENQADGDLGGAQDEAQDTAETEAAEPEVETLPVYTPVDASSVAESPEGDFIYQDWGPKIVLITGYQGPGGQVKIPAHLGGADRIEIHADAFQSNETITYLEIPETVALIGEFAFRNCKGLEEARVYAENCLLQKGTFKGCSNLRYVELGDGITDMKGDMDCGVFQACISLTDVVFGSAFSGGIAMDAFRGCENLVSLDLSNTQANRIGQCAFAECGKLKTVSLPATVGLIEGNGFLYCPSLAEISFPDGNDMYEVENGILYQDTMAVMGLFGALAEDVVIREGTTVIGSRAFQNNEAIKTVKLADSVEIIGDMALCACKSIESMEFGNSLTAIGRESLVSCYGLKQVKLPDTLNTLGSRALLYCGDGEAVFTYKGTEYTYDQLAELEAAVGK